MCVSWERVRRALIRSRSNRFEQWNVESCRDDRLVDGWTGNEMYCVVGAVRSSMSVVGGSEVMVVKSNCGTVESIVGTRTIRMGSGRRRVGPGGAASPNSGLNASSNG